MPKKIKTTGLRTWIEIDTKALLHNYKVFRRLAGKRQLMAVVKSNAYGHGLIDCAEYLNRCGVDWFGVDSAPEALALRRTKISKPILVLGYTLPENFSVMARRGISVTVSTFENLQAMAKQKKLLAAVGRPLMIHIKIDTGMHRQGFLPEEIDQLIKELKKLPFVKVEGLYTHLADGGSPKFRTLTQNQFDQLDQVVQKFKANNFKPIRHILNTPGLLAYRNHPSDMVRIGLGLYGLWPNSELEKKLAKQIILKPALTWKTIISEIKNIPVGEKVGYGFSETLKKKTCLAICPVGYWHGYPRALSSIGNVLVKNKRAKIIGRVSMDMIMIDVTNIKNVRVGDEVVLLDSHVLASEAAKQTGTISYEIVTRINPLIKRFFI